MPFSPLARCSRRDCSVREPPNGARGHPVSIQNYQRLKRVVQNSGKQTMRESEKQPVPTSESGIRIRSQPQRPPRLIRPIGAGGCSMTVMQSRSSLSSLEPLQSGLGKGIDQT